MQKVQSSLPVGTLIQNRYIVEDLLGKGGFSAVYLVRDQRVKGNAYALKEVINPGKKERAHFTFEGQVLTRLDHSSLPRVYRVFDDANSNRAYMLMDYIEGPNLNRLRKQQPGKRFALPQVMQMMAPIVDALGYLHAQHPPIIHRDVKPANIIVPKDGSVAVLVDFGIAKEYNTESTTTAIRRCSPGYGAPEQYTGGTYTGTDIYGLAATVYTLLTGVVPADALYRITQVGSKNVDPLEPMTRFVPDLPLHIAAAIERALALDSQDRFASVEEFWQALSAQAAPPMSTTVQEFMPVVPASEATVVVHPQPSTQRERKPGAWVLLFTAWVLLALMLGLTFGSGLFSWLGRKELPVSAQRPPYNVTATLRATPTTQSTPTASVLTPAAQSSPAQPTTVPPASGYPQLLRNYNGSLADQFAQPPVTAWMNLSNVQQTGSSIRGYFSVGADLEGNGNFNGSVTTGKKIQFLVDSYQGNLPLFFVGTIHPDGSMSGTYCSYQNGQCSTTGGHGVWNVNPSYSGS